MVPRLAHLMMVPAMAPVIMVPQPQLMSLEYDLWDVNNAAMAMERTIMSIRAPNPTYLIEAVGHMMRIVPHFAHIGTFLTIITPHLRMEKKFDINKHVARIDYELNKIGRETHYKLEHLDALMRNNNCQGSIMR
jgi:hypothetical protein